MSQNTEAVRRAWAAINVGDDEVILGLFAPDAEYQVLDEHPESRTCRGSDQIRAYFATWRSEFRDLRFEIEELVERGDRVIAFGNMRAVGAGSGLDVGNQVAFVYRFHLGHIVRAEEYLDLARARKAAGWL